MEIDLVWLSLLVFLPSLFALVLLFFPRNWDDAVCWWTLIGTAATLGVSIGVYIQYKYGVVDRAGVMGTAEERRAMSLDTRVAEMDAASRLEEGVAKDQQYSGSDWVCRYSWIKRFNIDYYLGIDGISVGLILLTTFLFFLAMIASFSIHRMEGHERFVRGYCMLFLLLETAVLGSFTALDLFLYYIFLELMLLPMYFLIALWGGPRREFAAIKYFLHTLVGSACILVAILGLYFANIRDFVDPSLIEDGIRPIMSERVNITVPQAREMVQVRSFDMVALARAGKAAREYLNSGKDVSAVRSSPPLREARQLVADLERNKADAQAIATAKARVGSLEKSLARRLNSEWFFTPGFQYAMFLLLLVGFAIKLALFPFHTWLPDALAESPTPVSMILAGVLLKLGGYGLLRIAYPICPWAAEHLAGLVAGLGAFSIVYGALVAMVQVDLKKLAAYLCVCHMGYVILGISVWNTPENSNAWSLGMNGAMFQMISHGITSAAVLFLIGVISDRAHHRNLDNFRGLFEPMPLFGGLSVVMFFAAMGLPGLCGFIGQVMVVLSTWTFAPGGQHWIGITLAILSALGMVLTAAGILWALQRLLLGHNPAYKNYPDITVWELCCALPLVVVAVLLGILPQVLVLNWMEPSVTYLVDQLMSMRP